mgnify:CR=1 FL=1
MAIAKSRHEYKFSVNEKDLLMLGMRLAPLIAKDAHVGEQGYYHIRSVYFDDYHNNSFYSNENSVGKMPFEVVMKNYKELELPHFESVRRTRAKIQSEHPELACSPECRKARKRMQHLYSNYVMN